MGRRGPELALASFSGPLDLLYHLVEQQKIDLYDIPIADLTEQYLAYLDGMESLDLDLASDFLRMAAELLQIKSRMLLPKITLEGEEAEDPRADLVLKLMAYRRCKLLANYLREAQTRGEGARLKLPETAQSLGLEHHVIASPNFNEQRFSRAVKRLAERNQQRFTDLTERLTQILKREPVSIRSKLKQLWQSLKQKGRLLFAELFPAKVSRTERVTAFLALLELLKSQKVSAMQVSPEADIELHLLPGHEELDLEAWLAEEEKGA